ncbi:MAG: hypothetical protein IT158_29915 [Bryobacterales bacterium]|nr:hypothetical protein [Bryobacterales bacterium]
MEPEFILEGEEARRMPRRPPGGRPFPHPRPRPRPGRFPRPFPPVIAVGARAGFADTGPAAVRGCGTLVVLNGFTPEQARLSPRHYSELLQAAAVLGRVQGSVSIEVVSRGRGAQARGEEVRRQLTFYLGLSGVRSAIRVTPAEGAEVVEVRACAG